MMMPSLLLNITQQSPGMMGWKDAHFNYLGCNINLASILGLKHPADIVGLSDYDLLDYNEKAFIFHRQNDLLALSGEIVQCMHVSSFPYDIQVFNIVKQPLMDDHNQPNGIIFHCSPIQMNQNILEFFQNEKKCCHTEFIPSHYQYNSKNKYDLSPREIECLFHILRGKTMKETAAILSLSKRTVETYYENIKNKFGCFTKSELLLQAIQNGYMNMFPNGKKLF